MEMNSFQNPIIVQIGKQIGAQLDKKYLVFYGTWIYTYMS